MAGTTHSQGARLLDEVGPDGYAVAMGRAIPPDVKLENARAMVDSVLR